MNTLRTELGALRLLAVVAPLSLAPTLGCTATVSGEGASGGMTGTSGTAGHAQGGTAGTSGKGGAGGAGGASGASGNAGTGGGAGTSGTAGTGGIPEDQSGPRPVSLEGMPLYTRFVRLTNDQWENSVRDILRLSGPTGVSQDFLHAVGGTTDFDNNERVVYVDTDSLRDFQLAAEKMADQVTATDMALQNVVATTEVATFIKTFGRRAFRRDLTDAEVTTYTAVHSEGSLDPDGTQSAFTKGARYVITAMLESPHFLYRIEMGDDGAALSGYEMAAKLSLWIRDTTPSDAMLDAADSFASVDGAGTQATAMLEEPGALNVMRKFFAELHKFALFDSIAKTGVQGYSESLNPELKESSVQFFDRIFQQNLGVRDILTSTTAFVGPGLAPIYGVKVSGSGLVQTELPERAGYFAQVPFMALWARNNDPDSIHRGARINLDVLCADPGLPSTVLPSIPDAKMGETNRMIISELTEGCGAVCHGEIINPVGFAFENYDGLGRTRTMDNGQPVDTTGTYPFVEGSLSFTGADELMELMASGGQSHQCFSKKMTSYALERDLVEADRPLLEALGGVSLASGSSLKQVMVALAKNDAFRTRVGGAQ